MKTVLFVHGLESGPHGRKSRALAEAGFRVVAEQMPSGQRQVARDPLVIACAALGLGATVFATARWGARGLAAAVAAGAGLATSAQRPLMRRMVDRSVAVQLRVLQSAPIDVVVGSSFGGAVVLELLRRGAWSGPTVLLCPAHQLVAERAGQRFEAPVGVADPSRVVIVHGRADTIVPLDHSRALALLLGARLLEVDDDHQLSATATSHGLASWVGAAAGDPFVDGR